MLRFKKKLWVRIYLSLTIACLTVCLFTPSVASAVKVNYWYDEAGRLTQVNYGSNSILYEYDQAGNLLKKIVKKDSIVLMVIPVISGAASKKTD